MINQRRLAGFKEKAKERTRAVQSKIKASKLKALSSYGQSSPRMFAPVVRFTHSKEKPKQPLFQHFVAMKLSPKSDDPVITHVFSHPHAEACDRSVSQFCFPDVSIIKEGLQYKPRQGFSETFSFAQTKSNGAKVYGFCRRFLPVTDVSEQDGSLGQREEITCICILSYHQFADIFPYILEHLEVRWRLSPGAVFPFLDALLRQPFPMPGEKISLSIYGPNDQDYFETHTFQRKVCTNGSSTPLNILFSAVSIDNILTLVSLLLLEKRVVLLSPDLKVLSSCCAALVSLLYPFSWQYIYVPVTPPSALSFVTAPMPFIIGVHNHFLDILVDQPMEEVFFVHLDQDKIEIYNQKDTFLKLPSRASNSLKRELAKITKKKKGVFDNQAVYDAFLAYFVILYRNYEYLKNNTFESDWEAVDDFDLLDLSSPVGAEGQADSEEARKKTAEYMKELTKSQLFQQFRENQKQTEWQTDVPSPFDIANDGLEEVTGYGNLLKQIKLQAPESDNTEIEDISTAVLELTSSKPPKRDEKTLLDKICASSFNFSCLPVISNILFNRFVSGKAQRLWEHAYKALFILLHLSLHGSDRIICAGIERFKLIAYLRDYSHHNNNIQSKIRVRAEDLCNILIDVERLKDTRTKFYAKVVDATKYSYSVSTTVPQPSNTNRDPRKQDTKTTSTPTPKSDESPELDDLTKALTELYLPQSHAEPTEAKDEDPVDEMDLFFHSIEVNNFPDEPSAYRERASRGEAPLLPKFTVLHDVFRPPGVEHSTVVSQVTNYSASTATTSWSDSSDSDEVGRPQESNQSLKRVKNETPNSLNIKNFDASRNRRTNSMLDEFAGEDFDDIMTGDDTSSQQTSPQKSTSSPRLMSKKSNKLKIKRSRKKSNNIFGRGSSDLSKPTSSSAYAKSVSAHRTRPNVNSHLHVDSLGEFDNSFFYPCTPTPLTPDSKNIQNEQVFTDPFADLESDTATPPFLNPFLQDVDAPHGGTNPFDAPSASPDATSANLQFTDIMPRTPSKDDGARYMLPVADELLDLPFSSAKKAPSSAPGISSSKTSRSSRSSKNPHRNTQPSRRPGKTNRTSLKEWSQTIERTHTDPSNTTPVQTPASTRDNSNQKKRRNPSKSRSGTHRRRTSSKSSKSPKPSKSSVRKKKSPEKYSSLSSQQFIEDFPTGATSTGSFDDFDAFDDDNWNFDQNRSVEPQVPPSAKRRSGSKSNSKSAGSRRGSRSAGRKGSKLVKKSKKRTLKKKRPPSSELENDPFESLI